MKKILSFLSFKNFIPVLIVFYSCAEETIISNPDDVVNYSGKTYHTVQIGNQWWLKENLDVGTMINSITVADSMKNNGIIEKYCYDNDTANCTTYGGLYQWNEAMQYVTNEGAKGICPTGWHLPTFTEFETLLTAVNNNGNSLKAVGQGTGGGAGTNTSGFSALLAGVRRSNVTFSDLGYFAYFWSSKEREAAGANAFFLGYDGNSIGLAGGNEGYSFSVRCVKD